MTATLDQHTVLPPAETGDDGERGRLKDVLDVLTSTGSPDRGASLTGPDGTAVILPDEVHEVLLQVVRALSQGLAISVAPLHAVLTTQQAADMLNISRPTLVKLLREGEIPFEQPGRHRRVKLADLLAYQERSRAERRAKLDQLTATANDEGSDEGSDDAVDGFVQRIRSQPRQSRAARGNNARSVP